MPVSHSRQPEAIVLSRSHDGAYQPLRFLADHFFHDSNNGIRFDEGRIDDQVVMSRIWDIRLEVLLYELMMFRFHLGDVLSRMLLGKAAILHDVSYPCLKRGHEKKSNPLPRGKQEAGASAQDYGISVRSDRKSDSSQIP